MRVLGHIVVFCLALAALQAILSLLVVAFVLLILWGLLFRTKVTVGLLALGFVLSVAEAHPVALIAFFGILLAINFMGSGPKT